MTGLAFLGILAICAVESSYEGTLLRQLIWFVLALAVAWHAASARSAGGDPGWIDPVLAGSASPLFESGRVVLEAFLPYGPQGSSARVRLLDWMAHTGVSAKVHDYAGLPNNSPAMVLRHPGRVVAAELRTRALVRERHDRVLIQRDVSPFTSGRIAERLAANSQLSVFDFDDAIMWTPRVGAQRIWSRAESCLRSVRAVDRVIAGNHLLADWASQHNSDVRYIPSCVETSEYRQKQNFETQAVPRLVWMGSPSTEPYVASVADELLKVHAATGARLVLISAGAAAWEPSIE